MKEIKTVDAVGQVLCHDMTQIIPGVMKDARFRKGHVVTEEDIPVLLSMGKEHIYVWEKDDSLYHENEAAEILCSLCIGDHMDRSEVKEGKIELKSTVRGLLKIDTGLLDKINSLGNMMIASRHPNTPVEPGDKLCGTRIIPLVIEKEKMEEAREVCAGKKIFAVLPYLDKKVGIVTTGSEVFHGRIKDSFGSVLKAKVEELGGKILGQTVTDDTGAEVISYGAPVLPGAMFLLSYYREDGKNIPIAGLPGCVMYSKRTVFDLVLPRLMADDPVTKEDLDKLGKGGLCLSCDICTYPNCGFGKGW